MLQHATPRPLTYRSSCRFGSKRRWKAGGAALSALRWLLWAQDWDCLPSNYRDSVPFLFPFFFSLLCASSSPARAAVSKGGVPDSSPLKTLFLSLSLLGGRSGLQGFCYSLFCFGAVDVLYALDVLCETQGLAWVGCRYFILHGFSLRSILECWETRNFVGWMMECGDGGVWHVACGMC